MHELGSLLGRWHQWRRAYSVERGYARVPLTPPDADSDDELEMLLMMAVEREVAQMPQEHQLAVQHVARAECMGVEVMFNPRLFADKKRGDGIVQHAIEALNRRLLRSGVI